MVCIYMYLTDPILLGFVARRLSVSETDGEVEVCFGLQDDSRSLVFGLDVTLTTTYTESATGEPYYYIIWSGY